MFYERRWMIDRLCGGLPLVAAEELGLEAHVVPNASRNFKGLTLSTTFHAVRRRVRGAGFKYLMTCSGCSLQKAEDCSPR